MKFKPHNHYAAVYVEPNGHIIICNESVEDFRCVDNGFMFKVGNNIYFSPYYFSTNKLSAAMEFSENSAIEARKLTDK